LGPDPLLVVRGDPVQSRVQCDPLAEHRIVGETAFTRQVDGRGARRRAIPDLDGARATTVSNDLAHLALENLLARAGSRGGGADRAGPPTALVSERRHRGGPTVPRAADEVDVRDARVGE